MVQREQNTAVYSPELELEVLQFWKKHQIFEKSLSNRRDMPTYTFYDGPPFATGLPHHGHLLSSTIKDIIPRYFTMTGHFVERRFGWDCHGLPVEHEIDKKFGKSAREVVSEHGLAAYNQACRSIVQRYTNEWQKTINRIGRWVDFKNDYKTMDVGYMESVWWAFKQLWNMGLVYRGEKIVPFSTVLETGLSNFEAGSNYQFVQDPSIIVLFKLVNEDAYLAIWTTTPWTLPSNLGICVNAKTQYVKVRDTDRDIIFYLAKDRFDTISKNKNLEILDELIGNTLVGRNYVPLFDYFQGLKQEGAFKVHADDYVTTEDGTGIVHLAPGFGEDDARVLARSGLKIQVCPLDDSGRFTDEVSDFAGQYIKKADKNIIHHLKECGYLYDHTTIMHNYPHCPRSDTPLIYKAIFSWYIKVEAIKEDLLRNNSKVNWVPSHIKNGRFGKWLQGARDWAVSRNRFWGTPIPIWINDQTGKTICIGSVLELEQYAQRQVLDLHRDYVDDIKFTLENENGVYHRVSDVFDCWFESGAMPFAQMHYPFENKEKFERGFPADFIAEGLDQTRGWFYTLTVLSSALFNKPAFKNVIVNGIVMANDGKKMSKRLKNYTLPNELIELYGADALRLYLINSNLVKAEEQRFSDGNVKDMVRRALLPWYNAFKFFQTYADVDDWKFRIGGTEKSDNILDAWIISRLQTLKLSIRQHMQNYQLYHVVPELFEFIEDLTNIYIRLNRSRFWQKSMTADKEFAYSTLFYVIHEFSTCMAPFTPFLAENIYQELLKFYFNGAEIPISVHLCDYPEPNNSLVKAELERAVARLQQILILGRRRRGEVKIKVKTPLPVLTVIHKEAALLDEIRKLEPIIKNELNVKQVLYCQNESKYITLSARPNSPVLGKKLQKNFRKFKEIIELLNAEQINQLERNGSIELDGILFSSDDILISREANKNSGATTNRHISIKLDTSLNKDLIDEGLAREVINRIQKARKQLNFKVEQRIHIEFFSDQHLKQIINAYSDYICSETLGVSLKFKEIQGTDSFLETIDHHPLVLRLCYAKS